MVVHVLHEVPGVGQEGVDAPFGVFRYADLIERLAHVPEPAVDVFARDVKTPVTRAQCGVPFALGVDRRAAEPLDKELVLVADRFTDNPNYPNMFGLTMNNQHGSPVGQAWFEYIWNFGGRPFKSTYPGSPDPYADMTPMFDSPESIAVVELFKEALKYQPEGALSFAWDERTQLFASGRAAQVSSFNLRAPLYIDPDRSSIAGDIATAVVPAAEGFDPVPPVGGWVIGINKDMAWDYIKWFTSPSTHREFVDLSGVAARYSAFEDPELADKYWWFPVVAESADMGYAECRPRIPESFEIISTVGLYVSRALTGELSSQEAMSRANEEIRQLLEERGYPMSE